MTITRHIKFFDNQFITDANTTKSSENSSYPFDNAIDNIRSKIFQPTSNTWYLEFDFGYSAPVSFFGLVGKIDDPLTISETATVTLKASNIASDWTSPPFSETLSPSDYGIFKHIDNASGGYRYWRLDVADTANPTQNEIGYIYLGDHALVTERTINKGFNKSIVDPTTLTRSINGAQYSDERIKYTKFAGLGLGYMPADERKILEQMFYDKGKNTSMFVCLDPLLDFSDYDWEYTKLVTFENMPNVTHFSDDIYSMAFSLVEVV